MNQIEIVDFASLKVERVYGEADVSEMTLEEVNDMIEKEGINYSADYGFKVRDSATSLIFSEN